MAAVETSEGPESSTNSLAAPLNAVQPLLGTGVIRLGEGRATTVAMLSMTLTIGMC